MANPNPRTEHLSPWQPGQSGNPAGRPKGRTVGAILRERLELARDDDPATPLAERVAEVIVKEALAGDIRFVELLLNRSEGKVPDRIVDETPGEQRRIHPRRRPRPDGPGGSTADRGDRNGHAAG